MAPKSQITCHVLDSSIGKPAEGITVHLLIGISNVPELELGLPVATGQHTHGITWTKIGTSTTDADGRCLDLLLLPSKPSSGSPISPQEALRPGIYQILFETKEYFERTGRKSFYPFVQITFSIENPAEHYHVPLLISPFSYTTYRGS